MLVTEHADQAFASGLLKVVDLLLEPLVAVFFIRRLNDGISLDFLSWLAKCEWSHFLAANLLENSLVHQCARPNFRLIRTICIANSVNMLELLIEDLMHFDRVGLELVNLKNGMRETYSMLEAR